MIWSEYLKTFSGMKTETAISRTVVLMLGALAFTLALTILNRDEKIILTPVTLSSDAWIAKDSASQSYKEAWGFFFALLVGNITPTTVDFVSERVAPYLGPGIYDDVLFLLKNEAQSIKDDHVKIRFEPRDVSFEGSSNKVFVYGFSFIKGTVGREERKERTYEYIVEVGNYAPLVTYMDTYEGKPRDQLVLKRMEEKEKLRKKQNAS